MPIALTLRALRPSISTAPKLSKLKLPACVRRIGIPILTAIAVLVLSVMLVVTIYFTLLDLEWVAFLLGVLFAAIIALTSQTMTAQFRLMRRTAELQRQKELLAEELTRTERQTQQIKNAEGRFRTVLDGVPAAVFLVDREGRLRFHNSAFEAWSGHTVAELAGMSLKEVLPEAVYRDLNARGAEALVGRETTFDAQWPAGTASVRLLPYPPGAPMPSGYYAFVSSGSGMPPAEVAQTTESGVAVSAPEVASERAYLDTMEQQLDAGGQAREHLLRALEADHFILLEQRIEALTPEGQPNLREVLLRLQEDTERALPPAEFFEIAERYDLMGPIDRWVVRRLLRYAAGMKSAERGWRMPLYCINVSASTLRDRGFPNHVRSQLQHWDIAGSRVCFEIHHGCFADQQADIAWFMEQLRPLGCRFTVDGFGSHKVSFAPFKELRFDYLKIDGSIVSQVLRGPSELTKVKALVLACRKIGLQTIAQFVEDDETRNALKDAGVDYVQGFGIQKPGPLAVVVATAA